MRNLFILNRNTQWILSCTTSIQRSYLASYLRWSREGQSCSNGSCCSRSCPKSKWYSSALLKFCEMC